MKSIYVVVILSTLIAAAQAHVLTTEDLITTSWKFYNDAGFIGTMIFNANGKISGYSHPNESTWVLNSQRMLEVYDVNGKITARYVMAFKDYHGKWRLSGKFLQNGAPLNNGWTHYLEQLI